MIKVDLLPKDLLPKKRNFLPHIVVAALAAVLFLWFGSSLAATYSELSGKKRDLNQLQDELAKLQDVVQQVKQLEQEKQLLSQKEQAVVQITSGRTVWSHELYILAGLVPKDIWLEHVTIGSRKRPVTVEVPNTNRSPGQPPTIKKTVVQSFPALRLTGYALSPQREKGVELVADLIRNMKADEVFAKRFVSPEMVSIERQKYKDQTVMKFVMDCEIES
jgi:Tfp pilus assembly protein PilN